MKYVDASAVLRLVFAEPGPTVTLGSGDRMVSSQLVDPSDSTSCNELRQFPGVHRDAEKKG
jgi:hypothetical protein